MRQRSFSLTKTKKHREIWSSNFKAPVSDKDESSLHEPTIEDHSLKGESSAQPEAQLSETATISQAGTPKPGKAIPVMKPSANDASVPRSILRPKKITALTQPVSEKLSTTPPTTTSGLQPSGTTVPPKAAPFGDRYERITTYLEKPLFRRVHELHERGEIAKLSSLINAAVREYLDMHYPLP